jgi:hypothetical protein
MNGGFSHSLEVDPGQASQAAEGFRVFGNEAAARLIVRGWALVAPFAEPDRGFDHSNLSEEVLIELDAIDSAYLATIDDAEVERCFTAFLAAHPDEFAPI